MVEANEQIEKLTKEQVVGMSDEEVCLWFAIFARKEDTAKKRAQLLEWLNTKESDRLSIN